MPCDGFNPIRCPGCPQRDGKYEANVVPPDMGDRANGDMVFIGEAPGKDEDQGGRPFIGKAGDELNRHYLWLAGINREQIYLSNTIKCRPRNNRTPTDKLVNWCSEFHLAEEIQTLRPRFVVLMGSTACSLIPDIDLNMHHGLPLTRTLFDHECVVIPMWHPAAGIHDTKVIRPLREDFRRLRLILRDRYEAPVDQYPEPDYRRLRNFSDMKEVMARENWYGMMAIDTETEPGRKPFCLTFSCRPGTGYMVKCSDGVLLKEFGRYLKLWRGKFVFHNFAYDGDVLYNMGLLERPTALGMERVTDTMVRAYNLARFERVGLKVLAYRLLGVEMQEFEDLVLPYSFNEAYDYLVKLQEIDWGKPAKTQVIQPDGSKKDKQPQGINTRIKRLMTDLKNCDGSLVKMKAILLERWEDWPIDIVMPVIERFGGLPEPNIAQVDEKETIRYACRDADVTLRLVPVLDRISDEITGRFAA